MCLTNITNQISGYVYSVQYFNSTCGYQSTGESRPNGLLIVGDGRWS